MNNEVHSMIFHSFSINGENVVIDFAGFRFISDILDLNLSLQDEPACNFDMSGNVVVTGGYVPALKLPAGKYIIQFEAEANGDDYCQDVTWNLKVE